MKKDIKIMFQIVYGIGIVLIMIISGSIFMSCAEVGGGTLIGSAIVSGSGNTAAIIGGAMLGGMAGNVLIDAPAEERRKAQRQLEQDREYQRRLDYERQSALQAEAVRKEIEEQRLFEEWKRERLSE